MSRRSTHGNEWAPPSTEPRNPARHYRAEESSLTSSLTAFPTGCCDGVANSLSGTAMSRPAAVLLRITEERTRVPVANERSGLEKQWDQGDNVSTEDLRVAL